GTLRNLAGDRPGAVLRVRLQAQRTTEVAAAIPGLRRPDLSDPVRKKKREGGLPLPLALRLMTDLLLRRTAGHASRAFGFGCRLFARGALQLFAFYFVGDVLGVHQSLFNPAYFSTSFFNPKRGKFTVILASSPSPSRRTTVPVPYLGCSTVMPVRAALRAAGGAVESGLVGAGGRGNGEPDCGGTPGRCCGGAAPGRLNCMPRSPKNCEMLSSEL